MSESDPLVTVIMPIRNEVHFIERSVGAVLAQEYPIERLQILVADGMSDDGTLDIIRALPGAARVRIIPNPGRKQAKGLNIAIPEARGEYIIRVDGHTIIAPDYVRECVRALRETGAANVGGTMNPVGITPTGTAIATAGKSPFAVPTSFHVSEQPQFTDTVYMGAWQSGIFSQVGLFNTQIITNEDYEHNYRIRKAGEKIYLTPRIKSQYYGRQTLRALAQQYYKYGIGKVQMLSIYPESVRLRQLVAPAFVAGLAIGGVLSLLNSVLLVLWLLGVLAYVVLNIYFSFKQAQRFGFGLFRQLPLVFLTIHLSWGVGFWVGIVRLLLHRNSQPKT